MSDLTVEGLPISKVSIESLQRAADAVDLLSATSEMNQRMKSLIHHELNRRSHEASEKLVPASVEKKESEIDHSQDPLWGMF